MIHFRYIIVSGFRYYAIVRPLKYTTYMTVKVAALMIGVAWTAPTLISFLPIFLGWYTTAEHQKWRQYHPNECILRVNQPYAFISSALTFWVPVSVMLILYRRIYKEALRQKEAIRRSSVPSQQHLIVDCSDSVTARFKTLQANGFKSKQKGGGAGGNNQAPPPSAACPAPFPAIAAGPGVPAKRPTGIGGRVGGGGSKPGGGVGGTATPPVIVAPPSPPRPTKLQQDNNKTEATPPAPEKIPLVPPTIKKQPPPPSSNNPPPPPTIIMTSSTSNNSIGPASSNNNGNGGGATTTVVDSNGECETKFNGVSASDSPPTATSVPEVPPATPCGPPPPPIGSATSTTTAAGSASNSPVKSALTPTAALLGSVQRRLSTVNSNISEGKPRPSTSKLFYRATPSIDHAIPFSQNILINNAPSQKVT